MFIVNPNFCCMMLWKKENLGSFVSLCFHGSELDLPCGSFVLQGLNFLDGVIFLYFLGANFCDWSSLVFRLGINFYYSWQ